MLKILVFIDSCKLGEIISALFSSILLVLLFSPSEWHQSSWLGYIYLLEWCRQMQRWLLWIVQIIICGRARWKIYYFSRNCIFRSLLHRSQILCLKKNGTLSTNKYVVLFGNMLKIMFIITLLIDTCQSFVGEDWVFVCF